MVLRRRTTNAARKTLSLRLFLVVRTSSARLNPLGVIAQSLLPLGERLLHQPTPTCKVKRCRFHNVEAGFLRRNRSGDLGRIQLFGRGFGFRLNVRSTDDCF